MSFKKLVQTQRSHEETIKYVQDIIDRSWETLNMMEEEEKESIMVRNDTQVEEVKMPSEVNEPLLDLDRCSLHELINILQNILMILLLMFIKQDLDHT